MGFEISELYRLLNNLIQFAVVDYLDENRVVCITADGLKTKPLPLGTRRAGDDRTSWLPSKGEQVLIFSPGGITENAVVGPSLWSNSYPAPSIDPKKPTMVFSDGAVISYDKASHTLSAALPEGGKANIVGDLNVTGNITATGNVSDGTRSMADDRGIYNGHRHTGYNPSSPPDKTQ